MIKAMLILKYHDPDKHFLGISNRLLMFTVTYLVSSANLNCGFHMLLLHIYGSLFIFQWEHQRN